MTTRDRRSQLNAPTATLNGVDFVEVADGSQKNLIVHFLNGVPVSGSLTAPPTITGGDTIGTVAVLPVAVSDWSMDGNHVVLALRVAAPGDFSIYTLTLASPMLDPFFAQAAFSFKALCPSDLDCETPPPVCPPTPTNPPPIDYLAKDFLSFRQALLDFSSLRYPGWQERSEADLGMVLLEAMASVADDLSYTQDRLAAEATLTTATQRRSVVRHARLIDYEPRPAVSAQTVLQFDVEDGTTMIPFGVQATAQAADGSRVVFETGPSLVERPGSVPASALWNTGLIDAYWFDDSTRCRRAGATSMYVLGRGYDFKPGQLILIETTVGPGQAPLRQVVQLLDAGATQNPWSVELRDDVFTRAPDPDGAGPPWFAWDTSPPIDPAPTAVTQITWASSDALLADRDLAETKICGNLVAASQGQTVQDEAFSAVPAPGDPSIPTIVRTGPRRTNPDGSVGKAVPQHLHTLAAGTVAWLPAPATATDVGPRPEILLMEAQAGGPQTWTWFRRLLDAGPFEPAYTLDPGLWRVIQRRADGSVQFDYDSDNGDTLRFGDGDFGLIPADGSRFAASYRVGNGAAGNVATGAISRIETGPATAGLGRVRNPMPATGGADAEPLDRVRRIAPMAFRLPLQRAVIPKDYEDISETQPWVARAHTSFRWTGSWLSVFTAADPRGGLAIGPDERASLAGLLNRSRMAGYESFVPDPTYVSVDTRVQLCAFPTFFGADVEAAVLKALVAFFAPDDFTFGQTLELSALEAAVQAVPGVAGILCVESRVRGRAANFAEMPDRIAVAADQILRCNNDPSAPERGSLSVQVTGGK